MLQRDDVVLVLVDVQGKLAELMVDREQLYDSLQKMVRGAQVLGLPIIWLEQNPAGLGPTIPELSTLLTDLEPIPKFSFSCCQVPEFRHALERTKRNQILLTGIETHICIYQTTRDLLLQGYQVYVVADCVSSRTPLNREVGLRVASTLGARLTTVEMALFEMLGEARGPEFKAILNIIK